MKQLFYKWILFNLMGWKIEGELDPSIKKSVLIIIPHTSWHDFYIGLLTRGIIGLEMNYVAKKELFRFPFGWYFRYMGGTALDRRGGRNKVDAIVKIFNERAVFRMAIAPEGTRKKVDRLKSGFYYIAVEARVPIIPIAFDYGFKTIRLGKEFWPTGNLETDLQHLLQYFEAITGKIPEFGFKPEQE